MGEKKKVELDGKFLVFPIDRISHVGTFPLFFLYAASYEPNTLKYFNPDEYESYIFFLCFTSIPKGTSLATVAVVTYPCATASSQSQASTR
jgi:hypothetical protein